MFSLKPPTSSVKFREVLLTALALPLEDHVGLDGVPADRQRHVEEGFLVVEGPVDLRAVPEQDPATGRRLALQELEMPLVFLCLMSAKYLCENNLFVNQRRSFSIYACSPSDR